MRLWILSDLHLSADELRSGLLFGGRSPEADVAVVAGDIFDGAVEALEFLTAAIAPKMPVVVILGNHEFFGLEHGRARAEARRIASQSPGLHLLDDSEIVINGVRFLGGTLWSDYRLGSHGDEAKVRRAMALARRSLSDHSQIDMDAPAPGVMSRPWSPRDARRAHAASLDYLKRALSRSHMGPTVIVTHHAPHPACIAPTYSGSELTPAYVSDLEHLILRTIPALWVHGHTHDSVDVRVGATRIVCNPRGFRGGGPNFDPALVVDL